MDQLTHPTAEEISSRHAALRLRLREAAQAAGRDPGGFRIVAVTKTFPIATVQAAVEAGLARFGENRVQEALPKIAALPDVEWHLVGHLQSNKVRRAVASFAIIHSIDSLELLRRVDAAAADLGRQPDVLLQVNLTEEASKSGFTAVAIRSADLVATCHALHAARVRGLMTIGPHHEDPRPTFAALRELRDALQQSLGNELPELSMGMSADAEAAVTEGATLVRIGTALFGVRAV